jgi:hypothetical protein
MYLTESQQESRACGSGHASCSPVSSATIAIVAKHCLAKHVQSHAAMAAHFQHARLWKVQYHREMECLSSFMPMMTESDASSNVVRVGYHTVPYFLRCTFCLHGTAQSVALKQ